jgi:hypothetical protein
MRRTLLLCIAAIAASPFVAAQEVDYLREVKPILAKHCVHCHGPNKQRSELRLDTGAHIKTGGNHGPAVIAGNYAKSRMIQAILAAPGVASMPPNERPKVPEKDIAILKRWIDQGAKSPADEVAEKSDGSKTDHWSFQPIRRPAVPQAGKGWARNEIDRFIAAKLEAEKLTASKEADRVTLIRRLSLDLTGLPPSPEEVDAFVRDTSADAYDRVVERLLKTPHYAERWARHWLDLARYADSNGFTIDGPRTMWPYRDWVIRAFERDLPMDQFILEQMAGDLLPGATSEQKVATGFHRNTLFNQEGGIDLEMFRVESVWDRVNTTGAAFLGLTINCAQCHDHKYDPISQRDYYGLFAFLNNCDEPNLPLPTTQQEKDMKAHREKIAVFDKALKGLNTYSVAKERQWERDLSAADKLRLPPKIRELVDKTDYQRTKEEALALSNWLRQIDQLPQLTATLGDFAIPAALPLASTYAVHQHLLRYRTTLETKLAELKKKEPPVVQAMVVAERKAPRETQIFIAGDYTRKGKKVTPGVLEAMHPLKAGANPNRLDLAKWLVDPANPLTARVMVNRVWQQYFGLGIVETENDFGTQGTPPSHPELLDWLASEFMARKWSIKDLHRLIVTSATYRQASVHREDLAKTDPRNRLLGRQNRLRLEAEAVRDVALASSGLLDRKVGGPSVFPYQPDGVFAFTQSQRDWKPSAGTDRYRRGMYTFFWRSAPHPGLVAFDAPDANTTCTRRNRSNTPLQALTLLNDKAFFECAQFLASRVLHDAKGDDTERLKHAFRLCVSREPTTREAERLEALLSNLQGELAKVPAEAKKLAPLNVPANVTPAQAAAWTLTARVILNLDEFITRE